MRLHSPGHCLDSRRARGFVSRCRKPSHFGCYTHIPQHRFRARKHPPKRRHSPIRRRTLCCWSLTVNRRTRLWPRPGVQMRTRKRKKEKAETCGTPNTEGEMRLARPVLSLNRWRCSANPASFQVFDCVGIAGDFTERKLAEADNQGLLSGFMLKRLGWLRDFSRIPRRGSPVDPRSNSLLNRRHYKR